MRRKGTVAGAVAPGLNGVSDEILPMIPRQSLILRYDTLSCEVSISQESYATPHTTPPGLPTPR
jgi:hypothetical protein